MNNYIKLINHTKNNILKLTKQLEFLKYINYQISILNLNQCGGYLNNEMGLESKMRNIDDKMGLESKMRNIDDKMGSAIEVLTVKVKNLDDKLKIYEKNKKEYIIDKINQTKEIEKMNKAFETYSKNNEVIKDQIEELEKDGFSIFDPSFKNRLRKELVVKAFIARGKQKFIKKRYSFVNFLIRKYYLSTLTQENSDDYDFLLFSRPKEIIEMTEDSRSGKKISKFKKAISKRIITDDEIKKRNFAIAETKKMLKLQVNSEDFNELIRIINKNNSELNSEDEKTIDKFYN